MIMTVEHDEKGSPFCNTVRVRSTGPIPKEEYRKSSKEVFGVTEIQNHS